MKADHESAASYALAVVQSKDADADARNLATAYAEVVIELQRLDGVLEDTGKRLAKIGRDVKSPLAYLNAPRRPIPKRRRRQT